MHTQIKKKLLNLILMRNLKQRKIVLYFFAVLICYAVTGCHKNINSEELTDGSSKALNSSNGIGGYDLLDSADRSFAFDYNKSGKADHIVMYRPGKGAFWIIANSGGNFTPIFQGSNGIGGFNFDQPQDKAFA